MRGLPASGKTTECKNLLLMYKGSYKRINRDDLRAMIDNGKWSKQNEKYIKLAEFELAKMYLSNKYNVIIDDTNLSEKTVNIWREFAKVENADFEIRDFTDVSLMECIKRDQKRPNYVGEKVIKRMYNDFLSKSAPVTLFNPELSDAVVTDLDGTLALHTSGRSPYDGHLCEQDTPNSNIFDIIEGLLETKKVSNIIIVSGRPDKFKPQTINWLNTHNISYSHLFMREGEDVRPDDIIKQEIYENYIKDKFNVVAWFDDRLRVSRMVHRLGLPLFRVGDPDADF
jgi:predicted kinase